MTFDNIRDYSLSLLGAWEDLPFDESHLAFKVGSKMFGLLSLDEDPLRINLKCDPEKAIELREKYPVNVLPGYHMNKKHWNTVVLNKEMRKEAVNEWIKHSYTLVFKNLTRKE